MVTQPPARCLGLRPRDVRQPGGLRFLAHPGLWGAGPAGRAGLFLLGGGLPLAAALLSGVWAFGDAATLWFGLIVFAAAWAFTLTAATRLALPAYIILCAYLAWYGVLVGGALAGTLAFALLTLWMLWLAAAATGYLLLWPSAPHPLMWPLRGWQCFYRGWPERL